MIKRIYLKEQKQLNYTIEDVLDKIPYDNNYKDLYPGYSEDSEFSDEYYFDSKENAYKYANEVLDFLNNYYDSDKIQLYRAIAVDDIKDIDYGDLGESWTPEVSSAQEFGSHNGSNYILVGETTPDKIDWDIALSNFVIFSDVYEGDSEFELPLKNSYEKDSIKLLKILDLDTLKVIKNLKSNYTSFKKETAKDLNKQLLLSIISKNYNKVKELLNSGADVNYDRDTPIMLAFDSKDKNMIKILIENGANINARNGLLLNNAKIENDNEMINLLKKYGAKNND